MPTVWFITHPDVLIDPAVAITDWPLSARGIARMRAMLAQPWVAGLGAVWSSTERKALDAAAILATHRGLPVRQLAALGENDRSATGYLPPAEFEAVADQFFARPDDSIRGWETACAAQARILDAVDAVLRATPGEIAIVAHGGVGALLLAHLQGQPISRATDQPRGQGGHCFAFNSDSRALLQGWQRIDP